MADKTFKGKIRAQGREITVLSVGTADDFISLTDIAKYKNQEEVVKNFDIAELITQSLNILNLKKTWSQRKY